MNYFHLAQDEEKAFFNWENNQFNLCDIVLSLTDNLIPYGLKIYNIFLREEVKNMMNFFICDFEKIKQDLGIVGAYVERKGNVFSPSFNPKRNQSALILSEYQMSKRAKMVYDKIMLDLNKIASIIAKYL